MIWSERENWDTIFLSIFYLIVTVFSGINVLMGNFYV